MRRACPLKQRLHVLLREVAERAQRGGGAVIGKKLLFKGAHIVPAAVLEAGAVPHAAELEAEVPVQRLALRVRERHERVGRAHVLQAQQLEQERVELRADAVRHAAPVEVDRQLRAPLIGRAFLKTVRVGVSEHFPVLNVDEIGVDRLDVPDAPGKLLL